MVILSDCLVQQRWMRQGQLSGDPEVCCGSRLIMTLVNSGHYIDEIHTLRIDRGTAA